MAVTGTPTNKFKYLLATKVLDLANDTVKMILVRVGFTFDKDTMHYKKNVTGTIGPAVTIAFVDGGGGNDSITDSGSGFVTAGFVVGNSITVSGSASNDGTYEILSVAAGTIEVATASLTTEGAGASVTIASVDELANGNGYTTGGQSVGVITVTEDDVNDRCDATFATVEWTASGGDIISDGALLFDDTVADDPVIGYIDFGTTVTAADGEKLQIQSGTIRLT